MQQAPTRGPVSKVELHIECQHLVKKDSTSKSDPCCVFFMFQQGKWTEVHVKSKCVEICAYTSLLFALKGENYFTMYL
jgi:hypothetical protein